MLFFLAMGSIAVYGVALAGLVVRIEVPAGRRGPRERADDQLRDRDGPVRDPGRAVRGTLSTRGIVEAQADGWFIGSQIPAFLIFLLAGIAETNRAPFDLPEAETELVAGFHTEYSGIKFLMFFMAEYMHIVTISAIAVTLFFGGWQPIDAITPTSGPGCGRWSGSC